MFDTFKITEGDDSTLTVEGELPADELKKFEKDSLKHLGKDVEIKGFRKGKVPADKLREHIAEGALWQEMAQRALSNMYPKLVKEKELKPIGRPNITITKLAPDNPLGFKLETPVLPEVTLPDYKKIAAKHPEKKNVEVTDEDLEKAIKEILARAQKAEQEAKRVEGGEANKVVVPMPELTDEFVQKLGDYKDVAHFKEKLRAELLTHKHRLEREKRRITILEEIMQGTKVAIPDMLVQAELGKMFAQFKGDVERVGMKFEDYLKQIDKSPEDLHKEWKADAEKRAKSQLVLNKIAATENITPDSKEVEKEVEKVLTEHPSPPQQDSGQAGSEQAKKQHEESVRIYISTLLMNEKVFEFLEQQEV